MPVFPIPQAANVYIYDLALYSVYTALWSGNHTHSVCDCCEEIVMAGAVIDGIIQNTFK